MDASLVIAVASVVIAIAALGVTLALGIRSDSTNRRGQRLSTLQWGLQLMESPDEATSAAGLAAVEAVLAERGVTQLERSIALAAARSQYAMPRVQWNDHPAGEGGDDVTADR